MTDIFIYFMIAYFILSWKDSVVYRYKIAYYEVKLKNLGVDITHVENITIIGVFTDD